MLEKSPKTELTPTNNRRSSIFSSFRRKLNPNKQKRKEQKKQICDVIERQLGENIEVRAEEEGKYRFGEKWSYTRKEGVSCSGNSDKENCREDVKITNLDDYIQISQENGFHQKIAPNCSGINKNKFKNQENNSNNFHQDKITNLDDYIQENNFHQATAPTTQKIPEVRFSTEAVAPSTFKPEVLPTPIAPEIPQIKTNIDDVINEIYDVPKPRLPAKENRLTVTTAITNKLGESSHQKPVTSQLNAPVNRQKRSSVSLGGKSECDVTMNVWLRDNDVSITSRASNRRNSSVHDDATIYDRARVRVKWL